MPQCWAQPLRGCDPKTSREHIITESLWDGPTIQVIGLPWCKTQAKTIGLSALTSKILCRAHNSQLSDVDRAGADVFRTLQRFAELGDQRRKMRERRWNVRRFEIDGRRLERWFLKTLINIIVSSAPTYAWSLNHAAFDKPPEQLVRAAYGLDSLAKPLGLYAAGTIGEQIEFEDKIEMSTLLRDTGELVGALFGFLGLRFLLYLDSDALPNVVRLPKGQDWATSSVLYHISKMNHKVGGRLSHYIHYLWNLA